MRSAGSLVLRVLGATTAFLAVIALPASAQQTGTIQGTVTDDRTAEPLASAQVFVAGTEIGSLTDDRGRYLLLNVPVGQQTVSVELIGYTEASQTVTVAAGQTATADFAVEPTALALEEIVVTGVSGATIKAKVPFDIATLRPSDIPVPAVSPAEAIQGKVAGATVVSGSGRPGSAPSILLRGATSINASGRDQEPLYIVDGVILSSGLVDLSSLDIEEIEIIKGAAAASLYGSRAANGVIQINTARGAMLPDDEVNYTLRTAYGASNAPDSEDLLTESHVLRLNDAGTAFVDQEGNECVYLECESVQLAGQRAAPGEGADAWNSFMTNRWPGQTFDQVERFFLGGSYLDNYVSATGRSGATNFHVSFSNLAQEGIMRGFEGFDRNTFRVNLDQSLIEELTVSASAFYSRSTQDQWNEQSGNPLFGLTRAQAGVDLGACEDDPSQSCLDDPENIILLMDPQNPESPNPIYEVMVREFNEDRDRFLGSMNALWSPLSWFSLDGNVSYDRLDRTQENFFPSGYRTIGNSATLNDGFLSVEERLDDAFNASITGTMDFELAENITNRTSLRYLYERQDREEVFTEGYDFAVADLKSFGNVDLDNVSADSYNRTILADGYYAITNFDLYDRYIIDALVRNDGSSLFGPEERRHWYYRLAGAWRLSQEPWFNLPFADELKLRYAYGTAGNRPRFEAQYETYEVDEGKITPVTLGNVNLKPEHSAEHEAGVDASLFSGRAVLGLTYARTRTEDQLLQVPLAAFTGYSSQWQNAGTLESNTWEFSLDTRLVQTSDITWSARVLFDRTRSEITELDIPPFTYGVPGQALGNVYFAREGEELGTFYGVQFASECGHLPEGVSCDGFTVNDDGFLVWVGTGGLADQAWGTDSDVLVRGAPVKWGTPFGGECIDRSTGEKTQFCPVGNSVPDYGVGLSTTFTWRGLSLYGLLDSERNFDIYNQPLQWAVFRRTSGTCEQTGIPEEQQKPIGYCDQTYQVSGLQPSSAFVEDGSYIKLREISARYRLSPDLLGGLPGLSTFSGITVSVSGKNLVTWTDYRGYDPEVGKAGGETGSAALARVDGYQYPNFKTWTVGLELNF